MGKNVIIVKNGYTSLHLSVNSKLKFDKKDNNTFGLMYGLPVDGGTCPCATTGTGGCLSVKNGRTTPTCYMDKVTRIYKDVASRLTYNSNLLRNADDKEQQSILRNTILKWLLNGGFKHQYFRLHYSGDFFDERYLNNVIKIIKEFPYVKFWVYTRSFWAVEKLSRCKNIAVYLSIDPQNEKEGLAIWKKLKKRTNVGLAKMGDHEVSGENIKFVTCPETSKKIKNEKDKGACAKCGLCYKYTDNIKLRNITFNIH